MLSADLAGEEIAVAPPDGPSPASPTTRSSPSLTRNLRAAVQAFEARDGSASVLAHRMHSSSAPSLVPSDASSPPSCAPESTTKSSPSLTTTTTSSPSLSPSEGSPPVLEVCEPGHRINTVPSMARYVLRAVVAGGLHATALSAVVVAVLFALGPWLAPGIGAVLGVLLLVGHAASQALAVFFAKSAEVRYYGRERQREAWEYDNYPEGEVHEVVELYAARFGLSEAELRPFVSRLASAAPDAFVDLMMVEELSLLPPTLDDLYPAGKAVTTLFGALCFGVVPLLPQLLPHHAPLSPAAASAASVFLAAAVMALLAVLSTTFAVESSSVLRALLERLAVLLGSLAAVWLTLLYILYT